MGVTKQKRRKNKVLICPRCGKRFKKELLLKSHDGEICVDCVVKEEMEGLQEEIDTENT